MTPTYNDRLFFRVKGVFTPRTIAVMGLMTALSTILSLFSIDFTPTFRAVSFTFIPASVVSLLYGPVAGLAFGAVSDLFSYIVHPQGVYFPGYALSAMVSNFIYALFLYKRPITLWRVLTARVLITVFVTFALNYVWNVAMYGTAASSFFTVARLISNGVKLPMHVVLIYAIGKLAVRIDKVGGGGNDEGLRRSAFEKLSKPS